MSKIRDSDGYPFQHGGQRYTLVALLGADGWALYVNLCPKDKMARRTGHRDDLPATATDEQLQAAADRLERRIRTGDEPDEAPEADSPNTAFDL